LQIFNNLASRTSPKAKRLKEANDRETKRSAHQMCASWSGAGGSRTRVQTGKPYAFYTLIPAFGFRATARPGPPTTALSSKFHHATEALPDYSRFCCTAKPKSLGTTAFERCLVPSPGDGIKPVNYCTSFRQREHSCCCQINLMTIGI